MQALTVVLATTDSVDAARRAVASLRRGSPGVEIVVAAAVDRIAPTGRIAGAARVVAPAGTGVPRLRALGMSAASGGDNRRVRRRFVRLCRGLGRGLSRRLRLRRPAVGRDRPRGVRRGRADARLVGLPMRIRPVPGDDARARREAVGEQLRGPSTIVLGTVAEIHESAVASMDLGRDGRMRCVAGAVSRHARRYTPREALADRLRFGMEFGRLRTARPRPGLSPRRARGGSGDPGVAGPPGRRARGASSPVVGPIGGIRPDHAGLIDGVEPGRVAGLDARPAGRSGFAQVTWNSGPTRRAAAWPIRDDTAAL